MLPNSLKGGLKIACFLRKQMEERGQILQGCLDAATQRVRQFCIAVNSTEIEEDAEIGDLLRFRLVHPLVKAGDPIGQRAAPARVAGHHLAATKRVAGTMQAIAHLRAQAQEVVCRRTRIDVLWPAQR